MSIRKDLSSCSVTNVKRRRLFGMATLHAVCNLWPSRGKASSWHLCNHGISARGALILYYSLYAQVNRNKHTLCLFGNYSRAMDIWRYMSMLFNKALCDNDLGLKIFAVRPNHRYDDGSSSGWKGNEKCHFFMFPLKRPERFLHLRYNFTCSIGWHWMYLQSRDFDSGFDSYKSKGNFQKLNVSLTLTPLYAKNAALSCGAFLCFA